MYCSNWLIVQYVYYLNMNRNDRNKTNSLKMLDGVWSGTEIGTRVQVQVQVQVEVR